MSYQDHIRRREDGNSEIDFSKLANFQDRQIEAKNALKKAKYLLYGGAASGGKSYYLRWIAIYLLLYYSGKYKLHGVRVGLFCEDYPALKDRHLSKLMYEFPEWLGTFNKQEHEFRLADQFGGGVIAFRNLDDPSKYLSSEFAAILVDELTKNIRETFEFLILRMRWPGVEDPKFIGATNPGGVGHGWVKKLWIDRDFEGERFNPNDFTFVKALYSDNKYIPTDYQNQLDALPEAMRRAYKEGDWDIFAGQFFTEFRRSEHVIEPWGDDATWKWFNALPSYCGLDYGYAAPSCVLWGKWYDGTLYVYKEFYAKEHTYEQLRDKIAELEVPKLIFADPSIWAKKDSPTSGADKMKPLPLRQGMNDRVIGWNLLKHLLKTGKIKIFSTCVNLIRTIPYMVYDDHHTEDLDTTAEDHAVDALRYLIATYKAIVEQKQPMNYAKKSNIVRVQDDLDEVFGQKQGLGEPLLIRYND